MSRRLDALGTAATVVLAVCAVTLTGMNAYSFATRGTSKTDKPVATIRAWRPLAVRGNRIGPARSGVTIIAFSDYQCPFCKRLAVTMSLIQQQNPTDVSVIWRHYPLPGHREAMFAASAAECAASQNQFEPMHVRLFQLADSIDENRWTEQIGDIVPDTLAFRRCLASPSTAEAIHEDVAAAETLHILGTPVLVINGKQYNGLPNSLTAIVKKAISSAK